MPENSIYFQAAYIAAAVVYGAYVASLIVRGRRLRERLRRRADPLSGVPRREG
jgi:hypothetical protein